ncbi:MAG: hypothetical protein GY820_38555 [Gammaproteobacteria bacterium]|nr:hypothetical protein [Gammaproteobacteria bacterium]
MSNKIQNSSSTQASSEADVRATDYEDSDTNDGDEDLNCGYCSGTGGDRWNDGATQCPYCDGEGYKWWL